jgi:hypothetical protein
VGALAGRALAAEFGEAPAADARGRLAFRLAPLEPVLVKLTK